ncbi:cytochrome c oxidase subunit II [Agriterribacter sp.]|uniref:cytochrome c oxidase subunit II n=1 Tax=Agriterribacter sp. TaxID=2821509 RepID=UPI002BE1F304|nr:cytochrome c oxidase subunit II [Agriterribacter sp.]HRP57849.1 cytochrome c oxidase subunit II [Agriterribacter sp.]
MTSTEYFIVVIVLLVFVVIFQISKASEYVSVLKGEKKAFEQNNRINAFLMLVFLVIGLAAAWWCNKILYKKTLLGVPSASDHGEHIDTMMWITLAIIGFVFVVTQVLLFWFAYRYQASEKRKVLYYPHNNKLELLWTAVPAIALTVLVAFGLYYWFKITGDPPKTAMEVEITGHQFGWEYRYPGKDNVLGRQSYKLVDPSKNNPLGQDWNDAANHDDLHPSEMHLVVNKPVKLIIRSQDVIHDVGLPHFRMKMDAVPGTPTTMWFTPKYTTAEMKKITGNENFVYEIACDQMCGVGHYSMRGVIVVDTQEEYDAWLAGLKPQFLTAHPDGVPPTAKTAEARELEGKPVAQAEEH